jgi:hypothetical protein
MKVNIVTLIIALAISALAGYGFYAANASEEYPLVIAIGSGIVLFITLAGTIAVGAKEGRGSTTNIRVLSGIFFVVLLIEQIIFSFVPFRIAPYSIVTGILLLVYMLIAYAIGKALAGTGLGGRLT